ncbi:MAG: hypothetical protein KGH84_05675 [Paracoccaceae bacterium]|nr:hypothetical protein [Paracoccaceae bacterium]
MTLPDLTHEEHAALVAFAARHGCNWKVRLFELWMSAAAAPALHRLRNTHGPRWLTTYQPRAR